MVVMGVVPDGGLYPMLANIYLRTAHYLLRNGFRAQGLEYLALALGECNRDGIARAETMRALAYARRARTNAWQQED